MRCRSSALLFAVALVLAMIPVQTAGAIAPQITRLGGADRYATAVAIAKKGWPSGADTVLLAYGANYPDAVAATPLAALNNAPILLTQTASTPKVTLDEIKALKVKNIILLGGASVISSAQRTALQNQGYTVTRYGGANRYATAQLIANAVEAAGGSKAAVLVTGVNYPDALSMGSVAGMNKMPVIFSTATGLPAETKAFISQNKISKIVSVGYTASNATIKSQTQAAVGASNVTYITGADRYATSLNIIKRYQSIFIDSLAVATGVDYPDALAGGVLAAKMKCPLLLIYPASGASPVQRSYVLSRSPSTLCVFGGMAALSDARLKSLYLPGALAGKIIALDPGHQAKADTSLEPIGPGASEQKPKVAGGTSGVVTHIPESQTVLQIGLALRTKLEAQGATVVMTRTSQDVNISNSARAAVANSAGADLFIRLHCDGSSDSSTQGISMLVPANNAWTNPIYARSRSAGEVLQKAVIAATGASDRGVVTRSDLAGFNYCQVPAVLIEMGFMTNPAEDRALNSSAYQAKLASGLTQGCVNWLGWSK